MPASYGGSSGSSGGDPETIVLDGLGALLGSQPVGTGVTSDGAGGTQVTSADVSAMLAAADDAAILAAIGAASVAVIVDPLTGTGWTVTSMLTGSGAVAGGAFTSTIPVGTTSGAGSYATRAFPFADAMEWEIQARVEITADTSGELLAGLRAEWTGGSYTLYFRGNGAFFFYRDGGWGFASQTANGTSLPRDGTLWLRMRGSGAQIQAWRGIGSGSTPPTSWTCVAQFTDVAILGLRAAPNNLVLLGFSNNSHLVPSGTTVVWRDVRVRSLTP